MNEAGALVAAVHTPQTPVARATPARRARPIEALPLSDIASQRFPRTAGLLAMGSLRQADRWDDPTAVATFVSTTTDASPGTAKEPATASRMLEEFLPDARRGAKAKSDSPAGPLRFLNPLTWGEDTI